MLKTSMHPAVPPTTVAGTGEDRSQVERRARRAVAVAAMARVFDAACAAYPKANALAAAIGVSESVLSEMRHGKRTVPAFYLLPLLEYAPSRDALIAGLRRYGNAWAVSKREAERRVIHVLRSMSTAREEVLSAAAADMGMEPATLNAVLDGDTQPIRLTNNGGIR